MTLADAASYFSASKARNDIMSSGSDLVAKSKALAKFKDLADKPDAATRQWTVGDVIHGAIGAAMGAGVARGAASIFGFSDSFADKLETAGMAAGAAMNTGVIKRAEADELDKLSAAALRQRRDAFRFGFLKAAADLGLLRKKAAVLPVVTLNPADLAAIPRSIARSVNSGARSVGEILGTLDTPSKFDENLTSMQVQKAMLEEKLEQIKADRRSQLMRRLLAKRRNAK